MKGFRAVAAVLCIVLFISMLSGCAKKQPVEETAELNVYASFYPIYALARMITEGVPDLKLHCLVQPQDGCFRDYRISDWDAALLSGADAVFLGGRGLESFESAVFALGEDGPAVSVLLYNMDLSAYAPAEPAEDSHWNGENPHIYLKTDGAVQIAERISASMTAMDPKYSDIYAKNLEESKNRLRSLKTEIKTLVGNVAGTPVIVMNEALVYAAEEFGLSIERCVERDSGENILGEELEILLHELSEEDVKVILIEKQAPMALCKALEGAGLTVARMDVLSTRSESEGAEGYFEALKANAEELKRAFDLAGEEIG